MTITDERLAELRRIAAAATPGNWDCPPGPFDVFEDDHVIWIETDHDGGYPICAVDESRKPDAEHIAAFDPPTTDALLAELDAARRVKRARDAWFRRPSNGPGAISRARVLSEAEHAYDAIVNQEAGNA